MTDTPSAHDLAVKLTQMEECINTRQAEYEGALERLRGDLARRNTANTCWLVGNYCRRNRDHHRRHGLAAGRERLRSVPTPYQPESGGLRSGSLPARGGDPRRRPAGSGFSMADCTFFSAL